MSRTSLSKRITARALIVAALFRGFVADQLVVADQLKGKRVAALATHGFEQDELLPPIKALVDAGATIDVVSPESGRIRGWKDNR